MRLILALVAATLLAPTFASATTAEEPRDAITLTIVRAPTGSAVLTWTPAPGAIAYQVFRGETWETLELLAETASLEYADLSAPATDLYYEVVSISPVDDADGPGPMRGRCITTRSSGFSLTIENCMPAQGPVRPLLPAGA